MGKTSTPKHSKSRTEKTAPPATTDDSTATEQTLDNSLSSMEEASLSSASASSSKKKKSSSSSDNKKHKHASSKHEKEHHKHEKEHHKHHHNRHHSHDKVVQEINHDREGQSDVTLNPDYHWEKHTSSKGSSSANSTPRSSKKRPSTKSMEKRFQKLCNVDSEEGQVPFDSDQDDDTDVVALESKHNVRSTPEKAQKIYNVNVNVDDDEDGLDEEELDMEEDDALRTTSMTNSPVPHSPVLQRNSANARNGAMSGSLSPPMSMLRRSLRESATGLPGISSGSINHQSSSFIPPFLAGNDDEDDDDDDDDDDDNGTGDAANHPSQVYRRMSAGNTSNGSMGTPKGGHNSFHNSSDISFEELDFVPEAMGMDEAMPEGW